MGLGHVPQEPVRAEGANPDVQGRQRRRASARGARRPELDRSQSTASGGRRASLGRAGEDLAASWYLENGYRVLARNWRCRAGEIDIVAARFDVVVICEVKTRSSDYFGRPSGAVDGVKQKRLKRLAVLWLASHSQKHRSVRFDVVEVLVGDRDWQVNVIERAFE